MQRRIRRILKYCDLRAVFATSSPRRRALAEKIKYVTPDLTTSRLLHERGISRIIPVFVATEVEEQKNAGGARATACVNARLKGEFAAAKYAEPVFAFDTVVGLGGEVFGKPNTEAEAVEMFEALCGKTHEVVTAVYFEHKGKIIEKSEKTAVTFGAFDRELVYNYVKSGAPYDKAGGYNIDDEAIKPLIVDVCGDYYNVVGLPLGLTEKLIEENLLYGENGYST